MRIIHRSLLTLVFLVAGASLATAQCVTGTNCGDETTSCLVVAPHHCGGTCTIAVCGGGAQVSSEITTANCGGQECEPCSGPADLTGEADITLDTGSCGNRKLAVCESWVDCETGAAECYRCDVRSVSGATFTTTTFFGSAFQCLDIGSGRYQYVVRINDVTSASGACAACDSACSDGCLQLAGCNMVAVSGSCCVEIE